MTTQPFLLVIGASRGHKPCYTQRLQEYANLTMPVLSTGYTFEPAEVAVKAIKIGVCFPYILFRLIFNDRDYLLHPDGALRVFGGEKPQCWHPIRNQS